MFQHASNLKGNCLESMNALVLIAKVFLNENTKKYSDYSIVPYLVLHYTTNRSLALLIDLFTSHYNYIIEIFGIKCTLYRKKCPLFRNKTKAATYHD